MRCAVDTELLAQEFPAHHNLHYLNHAALGVWPRRAAEAVAAFAQDNLHFGAAHYPQWSARVTGLRERLQRLINAPSVDDIALLKNTSEGLSVVAWGVNWQRGDNVVLAACEFPSNRMPWEALSRLGVETRVVEFAPEMTPEESLLARVDDRTRLLTTSSVHYGNGLRMDLQELGRFCRDRNILFCVDAIQSLGALPFDVQACHADFVVADGHKWLLGPEGVALFYCASRTREALQLYQQGWAMVDDPFNFDRERWLPSASARRFEAGSLNTLGAYALDASLSLLEEVGMEEVKTRVLENSEFLSSALNGLNAVEVLSRADPERRSGIVTFRPLKDDPREMHRYLTGHGIICARRGGGIRLSPHFYTPRNSLESVLQLIADS